MTIQRFLLPIAALFASTLVPAAEPAKAPEPTTKADNNACAWSSSIDDWRELDNRNLIVWVSKKEYYHVELSMPLVDLGSSDSLAFVDHNHDGRVCGFGMDAVVVPRSTAFGKASIIGMTRLDEVGLEQLAAKYKVKLGGSKNKLKDKANAEAPKSVDAKPVEKSVSTSKENGT